MSQRYHQAGEDVGGQRSPLNASNVVSFGLLQPLHPPSRLPWASAKRRTKKFAGVGEAARLSRLNSTAGRAQVRKVDVTVQARDDNCAGTSHNGGLFRSTPGGAWWDSPSVGQVVGQSRQVHRRLYLCYGFSVRGFVQWTVKWCRALRDNGCEPFWCGANLPITLNGSVQERAAGSSLRPPNGRTESSIPFGNLRRRFARVSALVVTFPGRHNKLRWGQVLGAALGYEPGLSLLANWFCSNFFLTICVAGELGFEPRQTESESVASTMTLQLEPLAALRRRR